MHFSTVWAAVRAAVVMAFNALTGTKYGYLNRKPSVGSLLDLFGPWPGYVVVEILVVAGVRALMAWPWVRTARREEVAGAAWSAKSRAR